MNQMLQPVEGKVLDVVVIPDFQQLFDFETEKKELEDLHMLVSTHGEPGCVTRCCFGLCYTYGDVRRIAVTERMELLEAQIEKEIEKPFMSSGHAFVVVDSMRSLDYCVRQSKLTPRTAWQLTKVALKESVTGCFVQPANRIGSRSISTFNKFDDEDIEVA